MTTGANAGAGRSTAGAGGAGAAGGASAGSGAGVAGGAGGAGGGGASPPQPTSVIMPIMRPTTSTRQAMPEKPRNVFIMVCSPSIIVLRHPPRAAFDPFPPPPRSAWRLGAYSAFATRNPAKRRRIEHSTYPARQKTQDPPPNTYP
ncbi:MAG TPA: hypothetical protein ENN65_04040 [Candidatus Hydrogenedentes bacterium]|nr:hypothetical protein [Candidatus Hydrogenedentota bacterium]